MKINNVSFGRAIKVIAPPEYTNYLAYMANTDNYMTSKDKAIGNFAKKVFNDTDTVKDGQAVDFVSSFGDTYIFSGKDANLFHQINNELNDELELYKGIYSDDEINALKLRAEEIFLNQVENGDFDKPDSRIIINFSKFTDPKYNIPISRINFLSYTSVSPYTKEQIDVKLENTPFSKDIII